MSPIPNKKPAKTPPLAADWVKENSQWFNKPGFRKETAMAYGIDAELTEEGWDVNDPDYYSEMDKRLKDQKGIQVDFQPISEANHFFKNSESMMTKTLDKYLKKETALF